MPNVHTLRDIKNRGVVESPLSKHIPPGHRLGSIRESELEKALRDSIKTASDIANDYKDLQDIYLERTYHDLDAVGELLEEPAQINTSVIDDPKEIDYLRLELEQANEDLNTKEYTIEYMEKGIESTNSIFKREIDIQSSERLKLMEENRALRDQLALKKEPRGASHNEVDPPLLPINNLSQPSAPSSQSISVGSAE